MFYKVLIVVVLLSGSISALAEFELFTNHRINPYEYTPSNTPNLHFFPADKARWNGYEITPKEWKKLSHLQRNMFIREYIKELERKLIVAIDIDESKYAITLDGLVDSCQGECLNTPVVKVIKSLLIKEKKNYSS